VLCSGCNLTINVREFLVPNVTDASFCTISHYHASIHPLVLLNVQIHSSVIYIVVPALFSCDKCVCLTWLAAVSSSTLCPVLLVASEMSQFVHTMPLLCIVLQSDEIASTVLNCCDYRTYVRDLIPSNTLFHIFCIIFCEVQKFHFLVVQPMVVHSAVTDHFYEEQMWYKIHLYFSILYDFCEKDRIYDTVVPHLYV